MNDKPALHVIQSCDDCAACCMRTPIPPFQPGEFEARDIPAELIEPIHQRIAADQEFDLLPCVWLNIETRRCGHYELRPQACRDFEISSDLCRLSRWDEGID